MNVSKDGKFAVASINPASKLGFAKQLARGGPYLTLGLLALDYFKEGEIWKSPPEKTVDTDGPYQTVTPKSSSGNYFCPVHKPNCDQTTPLRSSYGSIQSFVEYYVPINYSQPTWQISFSINYENTCSNVQLCTKTYGVTPHYWVYKANGDLDPNRKSIALIEIHSISENNLSCPPDANLSFTYPIFGQGGLIEYCANPFEYEQYLTQQISPTRAADEYSDFLWQKFLNKEDIIPWFAYDTQQSPNITFGLPIEPDYIESYKQPTNVSDTFDSYMRFVATGNHQSHTPTAPNYVPSDMVDPANTAIISVREGLPFFDPTTQEVDTPTTTTEGAGSEQPTVPQDVNITGGNITVNVEIPEDDTISQTEYEESNRKFQAEDKIESDIGKTTLTDSLNVITQQETDFFDSLSDYITSFSVPEIPTLASFFPAFNGGCVGFSLDISVSRQSMTQMFDKHCPPWNTYVNPVLTWFFYLVTALYVLNLAGRTLTGLKQ